ncbi:glycosyltransferase family 2 protein [Thermococcus waiotapuensis]|uniref:Glycosyltransferase family 2 protein n=1 Tax=Thermococcus waiotapuensis TaxID=90909 RepID=A0AAE4NV18_9EURY|nr:glycosyltransferase family 2 protein [Thermococcus waiotapuensis]MDV3104095.1 glycosyltransferase family 2 protein [Thermococcus waiotapuensis]
MYKRNKIGVVVPAYNEEALIGETLSGIPDYVDRIYVVDDGSKDRTSEIVREFIKKDPRITLIQHEKNEGVGKSIIDGYKIALKEGMDIVAVMAGDNQMDPKYLPDLLDPIVEGKADYTKGNRLLGPEYVRNMPKFRYLGNMILTFLTKIASGYWHLMDPQNGYTAISRRALERIDLDSIYYWYGYPNDLLVKLNVYGFRVLDVPIPAKYGKEKSKIKYTKYVVKVSWLLLKDFFWRLKEKYLLYNFHPLVFFYIFGIVFLLVGGFGVLFAFYQKFVLHHAVLFYYLTLSLLVFAIGLVMFLFAMLFDMEEERWNGFYTR